MHIETKREPPRGCGYRNPGGLYLISEGRGEDCAKLPIPLEVCPTCGQGIKPTRGWTWLQPDALTEPEPHGSEAHSTYCPLATGVNKCGLIWVGSQFYPTTREFVEEAERLGVSRRIPAVPKDFELGQWVFLAHREADWKPCPDCGDRVAELDEQGRTDCGTCKGAGRLPVRAVFYLFQPTAIEYVIRGDEEDEELQRMLDRGITPVKVERLEEQVTEEETA